MIGGTEATVNVTSRERGNKARIPDSFSLSPFDAIFFLHSFLGRNNGDGDDNDLD